MICIKVRLVLPRWRTPPFDPGPWTDQRSDTGSVSQCYCNQQRLHLQDPGESCRDWDIIVLHKVIFWFYPCFFLQTLQQSFIVNVWGKGGIQGILRIISPVLHHFHFLLPHLSLVASILTPTICSFPLSLLCPPHTRCLCLFHIFRSDFLAAPSNPPFQLDSILLSISRLMLRGVWLSRWATRRSVACWDLY